MAADSLGNSSNHSWTYTLEAEAITSENLLVFGSQQAQTMGQEVGHLPTAFLAGPTSRFAKQSTTPSWTLAEVMEDRLVINYTTTPPSIPEGTFLCNQTPASEDEIFYRQANSTSDDVENKQLTIFTTDANLEDMVTEGSLTISSESAILDFDGGGAIQGVRGFDRFLQLDTIGFDLSGAEVKLRDDGFETIFNDYSLDVGSGPTWLSFKAEEWYWRFNPTLSTSLLIKDGRLHRFGAILRGSQESASVLEVSVELASAKKEFTIFQLQNGISPKYRKAFLGNIGPVPVYAEVKLDSEVIAEAQASSSVVFKTGIRNEALHAIGVRYNKEATEPFTWINDRTESPAEIIPPASALNAEVSLNFKLRPSISLVVYKMAGAEIQLEATGGIIVEHEIAPTPHLSGRFEANLDLVIQPNGPAFSRFRVDSTDPDKIPVKGTYRIWEDEWHLFPDEPLAFTTQPEDQSARARDTVSFTAAINRNEDLQFLWHHNGSPLVPLQTSRTLRLENVTSHQSGVYHLVAKSGSEVVESERATLTVVEEEPLSMAYIPGGAFRFSDMEYEEVSIIDDTYITNYTYATNTTRAIYLDKAEFTNAQLASLLNWANMEGWIDVNPYGNTQGRPQNTYFLVNKIFDPESPWIGSYTFPLNLSQFDFNGDLIYEGDLVWDSLNARFRVTSGREKWPCTVYGWTHALILCNLRTLWEGGRSPVYDFSSQADPPGINWDATGYRLPTDAEWEKGLRGGLPWNQFYWGTYLSHLEANIKIDGPPTRRSTVLIRWTISPRMPMGFTAWLETSPSSSGTEETPILFLRIPRLPRSCQAEWSSLGERVGTPRW